ncbi:hypothetical protein GUJ93_ZPchr0006g40832 [Zizania palustris]|uniref:Uncharacterized protein n=1 Tax=Zizania palustris TaxID=103762 RepID=A0A8J5S7Y2_ZIZPA|nr:hypothetical protein GUJ93_ZPchr0006g40832 [Zizania palustris]
MAHISDIKLIRTDTTLDLSQKAEKVADGDGEAVVERRWRRRPGFTYRRCHRFRRGRAEAAEGRPRQNRGTTDNDTAGNAGHRRLFRRKKMVEELETRESRGRLPCMTEAQLRQEERGGERHAVAEDRELPRQVVAVRDQAQVSSRNLPRANGGFSTCLQISFEG